MTKRHGTGSALLSDAILSQFLEMISEFIFSLPPLLYQIPRDEFYVHMVRKTVGGESVPAQTSTVTASSSSSATSERESAMGDGAGGSEGSTCSSSTDFDLVRRQV